MKLNIYHVYRKNIIKVGGILSFKILQPSNTLKLAALAAILGNFEGCKIFNFFPPIFTMFFLYTIVKYVQLQILCTLPLYVYLSVCFHVYNIYVCLYICMSLYMTLYQVPKYWKIRSFLGSHRGPNLQFHSKTASEKHRFSLRQKVVQDQKCVFHWSINRCIKFLSPPPGGGEGFQDGKGLYLLRNIELKIIIDKCLSMLYVKG